MTFVLCDISGKEYKITSPESYEIVFQANAACAGLRLYFSLGKMPGEFYCVNVFDEEKHLFNGFCDLQKVTVANNLFECFVYARSSACLLVDNEALPFEYKNPTAAQLAFTNAVQYGFKLDLPNVYAQSNYIVPKGTSRFGALNNFVFAVYGMPVYADSENVLRVYEKSPQVKTISKNSVTSFVYTTDRSGVISCVDYKAKSESGYIYHCKSKFAEKNNILHSCALNLTGLPDWQRETAVKNKIVNSLSGYYSLNIKISGNSNLKLFDCVDCTNFGIDGVFTVWEIIYSNKNGKAQTSLVLNKKLDGELVNYVAKQTN